MIGLREIMGRRNLSITDLQKMIIEDNNYISYKTLLKIINEDEVNTMTGNLRIIAHALGVKEKDLF